MPNDLWNFACKRYARPGVESACLQLQAQGADVCLLLTAGWLGGRGVACTPQRADVLQQQAQAWQREVITPLREPRQRWRQAAQQDARLHELREALKQLEQQAERYLLERLQQLSEHWPTAQGETLDDWLNALGGPQAAQLEDAQRQLRRALREA